MRLAQFMSYFWWRVACPQPDGKFNCWMRGKPYAWTARLHMPWYRFLYPEWCERHGLKRTSWCRLVLSLVLVPLGLAVWLGGGRRWPLFPQTEPPPAAPPSSPVWPSKNEIGKEWP